MPHPLLQLDLFGGPPVPHVPEPIPEPPPIHAEPEPVLILEGQLDLLQARATRLSPVSDALADGRFEEAATRSAAWVTEAELTLELRVFARLFELRVPTATELAPVFERLDSIGPATLAAAARRGHLVALARSLESQEAWLEAARTWIGARRPADARRTLEHAVALGCDVGRALVLLGNLSLADAQLEPARAWLIKAFWCDPAGARLEPTPDDAIGAALDEASELVPADAAAWVPLVGFLQGSWPLGACLATDPQAPPARFHAALVRSRTASKAGRADVAARRELKALAPTLFARLMEEELA